MARPLKLAKFLPEFDVRPAVLTASNPSVPVIDESLLADVDPSLEIVRAPTLEPGYAVKKAMWKADADQKSSFLGRAKAAAVAAAKSILIPDAQVLWQPGAARALAKRLASRVDDVLWITAPPFSSFLLAPLARARGVAVVLDYRDEWKTLRETYEMSGPVAAWAGASLERRLLKSADAITTATPAFRDALLSAHDFLDPQSVHVVPNGYDPDDYSADCELPGTDRFVVTYAGTILTVTSPGGFLDAVRIVHREQPELAALLSVRFIGRVVATEEHHFADSESLGVERAGYMDKADVVRELAKSHLNLCLLADHPDCERIYPGKIFELMAIGRPVLTLAPDGALRSLIRDHEVGVCFQPADSRGVADYLIEQLESFRNGSYRIESLSKGIEVFHRRALAGRVAAVLRCAADARAKRSGH